MEIGKVYRIYNNNMFFMDKVLLFSNNEKDSFVISLEDNIVYITNKTLIWKEIFFA